MRGVRRGSVPRRDPYQEVPTRNVSDERRQQQREADRRKAREAVEALQSSEGWQHWLTARRHFHTYSLVI